MSSQVSTTQQCYIYIKNVDTVSVFSALPITLEKKVEIEMNVLGLEL